MKNYVAQPRSTGSLKQMLSIRQRFCRIEALFTEDLCREHPSVTNRSEFFQTECQRLLPLMNRVDDRWVSDACGKLASCVMFFGNQYFGLEPRTWREDISLDQRLIIECSIVRTLLDRALSDEQERVAAA